MGVTWRSIVWGVLGVMCVTATSTRAEDVIDPAATPPPPPLAPKTAPDPWAAKLDECTLLLVGGKTAEGKACLVTIKTMAAGTPTGERAATVLAALEQSEQTQSAQPPLSTKAATPEEKAPDTLGQLDLTLNFGRAELAIAGTGLGLFTGVVSTAMVGVTFGESGINPGVLILGGGIATTALGIGYGVGGYVAGDDDVFGENGARLATWGIVVGTGTAFAMSPLVAEALVNVNATDPALMVNLIGGMWILGGHAGAAAGVLGQRQLNLDAKDITLLTAGTAMSFATGLLVMPNLVAAGVQGAAPYSLALTGISWAGIAGTYYATTQLDLEIVDTLLGLGGATLGGTALMITMAAALPAFGGVDPQLYTGVVTASGVVGILGGFVGTVAPLTWLRKNGVVGEPKDAAQALRVLPGGAPGAVVDMSGAVVATAPLVTLRW